MAAHLPRKQTVLLAAALSALTPLATQAQTVSGHSLKGNWVRADSNFDPWDRMRIHIDEDAKLTAVPTAATRAFSVGEVLWTGITPEGAVQVKASDGNFYPAQIQMKSADEIELDISPNARGNQQTWQRAGPDLSGDWVRVAAPGTPEDGLRLRASVADAIVRFLPASAPRFIRVGSRMWQNPAASGGIDVLGSDRQYHTGTLTFVTPDQIRIDAPQVAGGPGQIWVRPSLVASTKAGLEAPTIDPDLPGGDLTPLDEVPSIDVPTPSEAPPGFRACVATGLPDHQENLQWGWSLTSAVPDPGRADTLGIGQHMVTDFSGPAVRGQILTDIERVRFPRMADGFSYVWQSRSATGVLAWEKETDLTATELEAALESYTSAGMMPSDVEAYATDDGIRFSGVWIANPQNLSWHAETDLTSEEYGTAFRNLRDAGYRLIDVEAYRTPSGIRYAGVWHLSCDNTNWRQVRGMDREQYQRRLENLREQGFRVTDFESYQTSNGQRYAAIWERVPAGRAWRVRTDRTLRWFLNYHREYEDMGMRLIDFESYDTDEGIRYAGVWAENDDRFDMPFRVTLTDSLEAYRTRNSIPGLSAVVIWDGRVVYRHGLGWADSADVRSANSQTIYLTASIAKVLGATMAARLEEQGRIDLSRPTRDFLPDLPEHHTHTVAQLLAKVGCVWHYDEGPEPDDTRFYLNREDILVQIQDSLLLSGCTPGEQYHYSTHGFTFVDAVLEKELDKGIAEIFYDELIQPFGLETMRTVTSQNMGILNQAQVQVTRPYHLAQGYSWEKTTGLSRPIDYENSGWKIMGGGLQTNALDLARFGWLTLNGEIVSGPVRDDRLWEPMFDITTTTNWSDGMLRRPPVGLGWNLRPTVCVGELTTMGGNVVCGAGQPTERVAEHGGVAPGARTQLQIYRDLGLVIAIMTNQSNRPHPSCLPPSQNDCPSHNILGLADQIGRIIMRDPPPG